MTSTVWSAGSRSSCSRPRWGGSGGRCSARRATRSPRRTTGSRFRRRECYSQRGFMMRPRRWHAIFRLLERDERVFAVLLAVAMVGGLATLGLVPLRPRQRIDLMSLVAWFALYKVAVFALVTVNPRATRR